MPEDVLDAPELEITPGDDSAPIEANEAPDPDHSEHEPPEPADGADASRPPGTNAQPQPAVVDGKKLSETAKAALDELKAKDPQLAGQMRKALFEADAFKREVPGGLKEVRELRAQLEDLGGFDGISQRGQELAYFNELDQKFTSADPAFVAAMTDSAEGQNAFLRLMPAILGKFSELNPDGHSAYLASAIVGDLQAHRIPLIMERLADFLPADKPQAKQLWDEMRAYFNRFSELAQKKVAPDAPAKPAGSGEADQREIQITQREWTLERDQERSRIFASEWARLTEGRKLSAPQIQAVKEVYHARLARSLGALPNYKSSVDRFFQSRDKNGYLRLQRTTLTKEIPKALRAAFDTVVPAKPGPKPGAPGTPGQQRGVNPPAKPGTPQAGFTWVAKSPDKNQINFRVTSAEMIRQGRAILTDGKKVQWRAAA